MNDKILKERTSGDKVERKIIQHSFDHDDSLSVLCNDGTIWYWSHSKTKWFLFETDPIPQLNVPNGGDDER